MSTWHWIVVASGILGLVGGYGTLESVAAAEPPIRWWDLPFSFFASVFGMVMVVGFQLLRRDEKYGRWAFRFMIPITSWTAASGIGAALVAQYTGRNGPAAWLFLSVGLGMALGLWVCWRIKHRRSNVAP